MRFAKRYGGTMVIMEKGENMTQKLRAILLFVLVITLFSATVAGISDENRWITNEIDAYYYPFPVENQYSTDSDYVLFHLSSQNLLHVRDRNSAELVCVCPVPDVEGQLLLPKMDGDLIHLRWKVEGDYLHKFIDFAGNTTSYQTKSAVILNKDKPVSFEIDANIVRAIDLTTNTILWETEFDTESRSNPILRILNQSLISVVTGYDTLCVTDVDTGNIVITSDSIKNRCVAAVGKNVLVMSDSRKPSGYLVYDLQDYSIVHESKYNGSFCYEFSGLLAFCDDKFVWILEPQEDTSIHKVSHKYTTKQINQETFEISEYEIELPSDTICSTQYMFDVFGGVLVCKVEGGVKFFDITNGCELFSDAFNSAFYNNNPGFNPQFSRDGHIMYPTDNSLVMFDVKNLKKLWELDCQYPTNAVEFDGKLYLMKSFEKVCEDLLSSFESYKATVDVYNIEYKFFEPFSYRITFYAGDIICPTKHGLLVIPAGDSLRKTTLYKPGVDAPFYEFGLGRINFGIYYISDYERTESPDQIVLITKKKLGNDDDKERPDVIKYLFDILTGETVFLENAD